MIAELTPTDWIGIFGSLFIAVAYLAVSRGWVDARKPGFNLLNLSGALLILFSLWYRPNAGAILIEVLWVGIAITALINWAIRR